MIVTSALILGLAMADKSFAVTPKVAIIGAGAGGSSAAFWTSLAKKRIDSTTKLGIDVYEKNNYIGGRSTVIYPYNNASYAPIELGASIFVAGNKNMMRAVKEFGYDLTQLDGVTPGIGVWDGKQFLYRSSDNSTDDDIRMQERYGDGPTKSYYLILDFLKPFAASYTPSFPDFTTVGAYATFLNYTTLLTQTLQTYLDNNGINKLWTREFEAGSVRFNYGQDVDAIQAVAGMASLSADTTYSVKQGNYRIFEQFLNRSGASVNLNTAVTKISKAKTGPQYSVTIANGSTVNYDAIVLAAPIPLANIKFENLPQISSIPVVKYVHLHTTLISTTTPAVLPAYFKAQVPPAMPGTIITTNASGIQPEINALRYQAAIQHNGMTEYIVKIFSKAKITDTMLDTLFGKGKAGWVYRKEWDAYPYFPTNPAFPPIRIDSGFYYVNSMEAMWSTMETEIISSRNVVDLLSKEATGYGICGKSGPKGPVTDTYVLGWDC